MTETIGGGSTAGGHGFSGAGEGGGAEEKDVNQENVVPGVCSIPAYTRTSNKVMPTSKLATKIRAPNLRMSIAIGYDDLALDVMISCCPLEPSTDWEGL